ncbi:chorismate-binding protein [Microbacterium suaedae]|uniref:chorismate-binding protein n=1 Tax=Microbacterium suaedae TaxID=2067813 RepID=UPI000DA11FCA|nr:chorismate-binding protein [Microbacterium suaedae]
MTTAQRPRVLLVDNHDSYTGSIEQLIWAVTGDRPHLVQSDAVDLGALAEYTHIVLGPGPGTPHHAGDVGAGLEILRRARVPVLGVCLGFQEMAVALGGRVVPAPRPAHGVVETVTHDGSTLFAGVPERFEAVRYHSLVVDEPAPMRITARSRDGLPMAGEVAERGWYGVQFHPESIGSGHGARMIEAFLASDVPTEGPDLPVFAEPPRSRSEGRAPEAVSEHPRGAWRVWSEAVERQGDTERLFVDLYGAAPVAVWLDSAQQAYGMGRFSILGTPEGPRDHVIDFRAAEGVVRLDGEEIGSDVWDVLADRMDAHPVEPRDDLPFVGGYVGSIGYGAKAIGRARASATPDAQLVHLSRFVVVDHLEERIHVVAAGPPEDEREARGWIAAARERILSTCDADPQGASGSGDPVATPRTTRGDGASREHGSPSSGSETADPAPADATVTRSQYLRDLSVVRTWLAAGDSYEACYTYTLRFPHDGPALDAYRRLRRTNPAPYAAFLRLPGREVMSCSPERFLAVTSAGWAETKPIKGTARRVADPEADADVARALAVDPKTRAENLMIVDLLRNDLGRISAPGTVTVPSLMAVESYATVHQLVTSVRSELLPRDAVGVRAAEALFPPGSMTGAPKRRTVEMLDALEAAPRGAYSGVVGYFSRCGSVDLSVVIRTAVAADGEVTIGTGGAITYDSDPDAEADETVAKSTPLLRAFGRTHPFV